MAEEIRSIRIEITVDTNKRTTFADIDSESLDDALDQTREALSDVRWALR